MTLREAAVMSFHELYFRHMGESVVEAVFLYPLFLSWCSDEVIGTKWPYVHRWSPLFRQLVSRICFFVSKKASAKNFLCEDPSEIQRFSDTDASQLSAGSFWLWIPLWNESLIIDYDHTRKASSSSSSSCCILWVQKLVLASEVIKGILTPNFWMLCWGDGALKKGINGTIWKPRFFFQCLIGN